MNLLGLSLDIIRLLWIIFSAPADTIWNWLFGDNFVPFPAGRCYATALLNGLILGIDEFDRYNQIFAESGYVEMAQLGKYVGPDAIEEYVRAAFAETNWFLRSNDPDQLTEFEFDQYHDGKCIFLVFSKIRFDFDPETSIELPRFSIVAVSKFFFDIQSTQITGWNLHWPNDMFRVLAAGIQSENAQRVICDEIISIACQGILNIENCRDKIAALPAASEGNLEYMDGNSQGCRALHSVFAVENPTTHCPHLSFDPLEDPNGQIKCQESKQTPISALFSDRELDKLKEFAARQGIDPELGHDCTEDICK